MSLIEVTRSILWQSWRYSIYSHDLIVSLIEVCAIIVKRYVNSLYSHDLIVSLIEVADTTEASNSALTILTI